MHYKITYIQHDTITCILYEYVDAQSLSVATGSVEEIDPGLAHMNDVILIVILRRVSGQLDPRGGYCHTKVVGVCHQSPMEHMEREREIKKFRVTKR